MLSSRKLRFAGAFAAIAMAFSMVAVDHADARRMGGGGGFGSRGSRTYQSAPATATAPSAAAPVQRSMTPNAGPQAGQAGNAARNAGQQRPGFMNGFGGSLLRGLAIGGLIGMLFGGGFGGMAGLFGMFLQIALIGGGIYLLMRFLRSRSSSTPAMAGGPAGGNGMNRSGYEPQPSNRPAAGGLGGQSGGLGGGLSGLGAKLGGQKASIGNPDEIGVSPQDLSTFERMLADIQGAYGREDYASLRVATTPEMMSYFSEELGTNASNGVKNEVSDVKLLQGDVSEAWREGQTEYATVAMRYSSIDATRERATGRVIEGNAETPSESTEVWTFTRQGRGAWLLSAIQSA